MPSPILFLSGAGLLPWIWDDVRSALPVESRVADYPRGDASLETYADAALAAADGWDRFRIVAHSIGGVVAAAVVGRAPERVPGLVAVSASVPAAGSSFVGALPVPQRQVMGIVIRLLGTRPPDKAIREGLCAGLDDELAARIVAEFAPESKALYRDPVPARAFTDAVYVLTEQDTQFPPSLQQKYAAELGGDVVRMDTAHLPMLQQPARLAEIIAASQAS